MWEDDWTDHEKKKLWHGTTVAVDHTGDGTSVQEEVIPLPYQPSTYVLSFLFAVCQEVHRVAAHTPDKVWRSILLLVN